MAAFYTEPQFSLVFLILLIDSLRSPFGLPAAVVLRFASVLSKNSSFGVLFVNNSPEAAGFSAGLADCGGEVNAFVVAYGSSDRAGFPVWHGHPVCGLEGGCGLDFHLLGNRSAWTEKCERDLAAIGGECEWGFSCAERVGIQEKLRVIRPPITVVISSPVGNG